MHRHGVAGTGTADVRRAAGVSASQIYHYFTDKDGLVRAVVDHQVDRVVGSQSVALAEVDDVAGLRAWRDVVVSAAAADGFHGCPVGSLAGELVEDSDWAREVKS